MKDYFVMAFLHVIEVIDGIKWDFLLFDDNLTVIIIKSEYKYNLGWQNARKGD